VAELLRNLLYDLRQRAGHIEASLGVAPQAPLPAIAEQYRQRMIALLSRARTQIELLSNDVDLLYPALVRGNFRAYKSLSRLVSMIEWGPVAAIRRFSAPDDVIMCLMTERICHEIGYPFPTPLCVAGAYGHYSTYADMDLILAPSAEPYHLLGLSDLYHELGHIISLRMRHTMIDPFNAEIDLHFAGEIRRARQDGKPPALVRKLEALQAIWKEWSIEFVADVVATYLTGPAYGWANVRLCMNISGVIFESNASHPADEARATMIELVLESLGCDADCAAIRSTWTDFVGLNGRPRPVEFDIDFPRDLLVRLGDFVVAECHATGLRERQPHVGSSSLHLTSLLGEAWTQFANDPGGYAPWEAMQVERLKREIGA
jgi:hypothetical protein